MKWYTSQGTFGLFLYHQALQCKSCWKKIIISLICNCKRQLQILATQPWVPTTVGKKGTCHTDIIYMVETRVGRGEQPIETMLEGRTALHRKHEWQEKNADCTGLPMLAQTTHWHRWTNKQTQQNKRECRPLLDALVQVCHKTPLGHGECRHSWMHWHLYITILQTLKGTQMLFVVNSVKLH